MLKINIEYTSMIADGCPWPVPTTGQWHPYYLKNTTQNKILFIHFKEQKKVQEKFNT